MSNVFKIPKDLPANTWIKIVNVTESGELIPCSGGDTSFRYSAPKKRKGVWTPGATTVPVPVHLCETGYHITRTPLAWSREKSSRAFWALPFGTGRGNECKTAFSSVQLVRPLQLKDFAKCGLSDEEKLRLLHTVVPGGVLRRVLATLFRQMLPKLSANDYQTAEPFNTNKRLRAACTNCLNDIYNGNFVRARPTSLRLWDKAPACGPIEAPRHLCDGEYTAALSLLAKLFAMLGGCQPHIAVSQDEHWSAAYKLVVDSISVELRNAYGYDLNYDKPLVYRKDGKFYPASKRKRTRG